jgi:hypothetical protein
MKSSSSTFERPFWETAHRLYESARERDGDSVPSVSLLSEMQSLMHQMLEELRQGTQGIITQAARDQYNLTVTNQSAEWDAVDVLTPGDLRLISPRYLLGSDQPFVVLLLDQYFETNLWTVVPFSHADTPLRAGEWRTELDEPHTRVLCFWNARQVQGCVLEDSEPVGGFSDAETAHCASLHEAWSSRRVWDTADLARSGDQWSTSPSERSAHEECQREIIRSLTSVGAFHPSGPTGPAALTASASEVRTQHAQTYVLSGFACTLNLRSMSAGVAEVVLSPCQAKNAASLDSPVLVTGDGTEYPLREDTSLQVPMHELSHGFWINAGESGRASLVAVKAS